ncbi:hypothetical protein NDU88_005571 [Pleurodeles waltl]|uniref:Uncharacterized protein n=1 Tax=Pleurodeles waltl TaxID=8319 RepID=A0AAV7QIJ1_PLEWA|nr:hypothetical protein NDU88_005571 [Pleurodeles waltl]
MDRPCHFVNRPGHLLLSLRYSRLLGTRGQFPRSQVPQQRHLDHVQTHGPAPLQEPLQEIYLKDHYGPELRTIYPLLPDA